MPNRQVARLFLAGFILATCLLSACSSLLPGKRGPEISEQLYIDAKLNFAIKHPLTWHRVKIPVSSPGYHPDRVIWTAENPLQQGPSTGSMMIVSTPGDKEADLVDLLSSFLSGQPELQTGRTEPMDHPAGPALKLLGHDTVRGRLTIALKGQQNDFIISLEYPSAKFDELLPIFQEIVDSFTEIIRPDHYPSAETD